MVKLDLKDKKLLYELDLNARETTSKLAKKVRLSQQAISYRIKNLIEKGIIRQFYTVINVAKLGYTFYKVYFRLQNINPKIEREIINFLVDHKNVFWVGTCDGAWDLSTSVLAKHVVEFEKILEEINSKFAKYILTKSILIVSQVPHFTKAYLLDKATEREFIEFGGIPEEIKIDEIDYKILKMLSNNARISLLEIVEKTNLTLDVVRYRIKKLQKEKIIQSFRIWIDLDLIDYKFYKLLVSLQNYSKEDLDNLIDFCKTHKNIVYILKTLGGWDLEIEIEVEDIKDFHNIVVEFRNNFQNIIKDYQPLLIFREHKLNYYPF